MIDLEARLTDLGDLLDVDDAGLVESILTRLDRSTSWDDRRVHRRLQLVAVFVLVVTAAVVVHPDSRGVVARWFGLDQVRIERRLDLELPDTPATFDLPGPGDSRIVEVGDREILVSTIDGRLAEPLLRKMLGSNTSIVEADVAGHPGLWIDGAPHEVMYETSDGDVAIDRVAGNTLLWQVGDVLYRVEGFGDVDHAIAFAVGPPFADP